MSQLVSKSLKIASYNLLKYIVVLGVIFLLLPFFMPTYILTLLILVIIYSILAMSTDLLIGYSGMFSLGQAAFWGSGAYITALLVTNGIEVYPYVVVGVVIGVVIISGLLGCIIIRTSGIYFLLVSLAFTEMLYAVVWTQRQWTMGDLGITGIERPFTGFPFYLNTSLNFYFFALMQLIICYALLNAIVHSFFGLICQGIRDNESRIRALGYNVSRYKLLVFIISAIFSAIAGSLSAYFNRCVSPDDFGFFVSATGILMIIIGGSGTLTGGILGAVMIIGLKFFISTYTQHWPMVVGIIFVICILFFPRGIGNYLFSLLRK